MTDTSRPHDTASWDGVALVLTAAGAALAGYVAVNPHLAGC